MAILAYIRVSTNVQELERQRNNISRYATANQIIIDQFIERKASVTKDKAVKIIDELINSLSAGDTLLVDEISRLGRGGIGEAIRIVNVLIKEGITTIIISQNWVLNTMDAESEFKIAMFSYFARMEAEYIGRRTKEGLAAAKNNGKKLGAKKGQLQKSKLDEHIDKIKELMSLGVPNTKIADKFGTSRTAFYHFIETRKLRSA